MPTKSIGNLVTSKPKAIILVILILTVIFGYAASGMEFSTDEDSFNPKSRISVASTKVSDQFGQESQAVQLIVRTDNGNVLSQSALMETLSFEWQLENNTIIGDTMEGTVQGPPDMLYGMSGMLMAIPQVDMGLDGINMSTAQFGGLKMMGDGLVYESMAVEGLLASGATDVEKQDALDAFYTNVTAFNTVIGQMSGGSTPPQSNISMRQMQIQWLNNTNDSTIVSLVQDAFAYDNTDLRAKGTAVANSVQNAFITSGFSTTLANVSLALDHVTANATGLTWDANNVSGYSSTISSLEQTMVNQVRRMPDIGDQLIGFTENFFRLFSSDFSSTTASASDGLMLVYQSPEADEDDIYAAQENITVMAKAHTGDHVYLQAISMLLFMEKINEAAQNDISVLMPIVLTFVIIVLLINYRSLQDVILSAMALSITILWVFGVAVILGYSFNIMLIAVPLILLGLGIDYAIHLIMRYREELKDGKSIKRSASISILTVGGALALTTVTTMIGFMSNTTSSIGPIADFGILTSFGIIVALFVMVTFVPAMKVLLDSRRQKKGKHVYGMIREGNEKDSAKVDKECRISTMDRFLGSSAVAAEKHPFKLLLIVGILTAAGAWGALQLETEFDIMDFLPEDLEESQTLVYLLDNFEFSEEYVYIYMEGDLSDPAILAEVDATATRTLDSRGVLDGEDPITVASVLGEMVTATPEDIGYNATIVSSIESRDSNNDDLPESDLAALYDIIRHDESAWGQLKKVLYFDNDTGEYSASVLRIRMDASGEDDVEDLAKDLRADMAPLKDTSGVTDAIVTGGAIVTVETMDEINYNQIRSLGLTILLSFIILTVVLAWMDKSVALGPITMIPIIIIIIWMWGSMYVLGIKLNVMTNMVAALSVGLGLDYAIHVTHRFKEELEKTDDVNVACREAVTNTGSAITGAAVTTMGAFGILTLSSLRPMQLFGGVVALAVLYGYLSSVFILPTLLVLWAKAKQKKENKKSKKSTPPLSSDEGGLKEQDPDLPSEKEGQNDQGSEDDHDVHEGKGVESTPSEPNKDVSPNTGGKDPEDGQ